MVDGSKMERLTISRIPLHALVVHTNPEGQQVILDLGELGPGDIIFLSSCGMYFPQFIFYIV